MIERDSILKRIQSVRRVMYGKPPITIVAHPEYWERVIREEESIFWRDDPRDSERTLFGYSVVLSTDVDNWKVLVEVK